jgi:CRISPR-associated protein Cmr3
MATKTATTMRLRWCGLRLDPCDVLFFRDGRPLATDTFIESGLPTPQTLAGAIRTHLLEQAGCDTAGFKNLGRLLAAGKDFAAAVQKTCGAGWIAHVHVRGPWLSRAGEDSRRVVDVFTPVPAMLRRAKRRPQELPSLVGRGAGGEGAAANSPHPNPLPKGEGTRLLRLDPLDKRTVLPGWEPPLPGMRPLWLKDHAASRPQPGYLTHDGLQVLLQGGVPDVRDAHLLPEGEIFRLDHRRGVALDVQRKAAALDQSYGIGFLALKPGMGFYAEVGLPEAAPATAFSGQHAMSFGGEGRHVLLHEVEPFAWPSAAPRDGQGTLVVLTTPGLFGPASFNPEPAATKRLWRPEQFNDPARLVAAAVPEALPVSGWNLATGGPKPTRFAAPAGSVYFLEGSAEHLAGGCLADSPEDRLQGWGCFARGVWNDV